MMYDPAKHHRRSIRLKGYDYSRAGLYFVTICIQNRMHLLGRIENKQMILNDAGRMVEKWYYELEKKYPDKRCHEMIVMPNHFHCIIENLDLDAAFRDVEYRDDQYRDAQYRDAHVGTSLRGRPETDGPETDERGRPETDGPETDDPETDKRGRPETNERGRPKKNQYGMDNKKYNATIGDAMDWFKTMTTNEYIRGVKQFSWQRFNGKLWQRNYWEHIIRNDQSYFKISEYIIENPAKWDEDKLK